MIRYGKTTIAIILLLATLAGTFVMVKGLHAATGSTHVLAVHKDMGSGTVARVVLRTQLCTKF